MNPLITREFPQAKAPMLRVQIGRTETRPEKVPIYGEGANRKKVIGHMTGESTVSTFHLLGCGETMKQAKKMASPST